jgi:hypothetical protein
MNERPEAGAERCAKTIKCGSGRAYATATAMGMPAGGERPLSRCGGNSVSFGDYSLGGLAASSLRSRRRVL